MKRIWKLAIIAGIVLIIAGLLATKMNPDSGWKMGTSGMDASEVSDSCDSVRSEIRDTATLVWNDSVPRVDSAIHVVDSVSRSALDTAIAGRDTASVALDTAQIARDTASLALIDALAALDTASAARDTATMALDTASIALIDALAALDTASAGRDTASVALDTAQLAYGWGDWRGLELVEITGTDTITAAGGHLHIKEGANIAISKDTDTLIIATTGLVSASDFAKVTDDTTNYQTAFGWGDWSTTVGKITDDTTNYQTAFGWGDHAGLYATVGDFGKVTDDTTNWNSAFGWGDWSTTVGKITDDTTTWNTAVADLAKVTDDTTNYQSAYSRTSGATTQWVTGAMMDSTDNPVIFSSASRITSAEADSAYVTKGYVDAHDVTNDVYVWAYLTTADQAIVYNTWTQVAFNAEKRDLGADFNTTTNEFTAPDSGFYVIGARANIQDNGGATDAGGSLIAIYRNDSIMVRGTKLIGYIGDPVSLDITDLSCGPVVSATLYCSASATIQIYAYQDFQDAGGGLIKQTAEETWITIRKVN